MFPLRWHRAFVLAIVLTLFLVGAVLADGPVHWGYEGDEGPEHWGELSPTYALCATGKEQTPVDIQASAPVNEADISFSYKATPLTVWNNSHTFQVNYAEGSSMTLDNTLYSLLQFHFHNPSEHAVSGKPYEMELHLVHQNAAGGLAVVGVLIQEGAENAAFAPLVAHLPAEPSEAQTVSGVMVDAAALLPSEQDYYRYNGSLTTPPCTEGVRWLVMNEPIELSRAQIDAIDAIMPENARPLQPLNNRQFLQGPQAAAPPAALPTSGADASSSLPSLLLTLGALYLTLGLILVLTRRQHT